MVVALLFAPGLVMLLGQSVVQGVPWPAVSAVALCFGCSTSLLMLSWGTTWSVIGHGCGAAIVVMRDTAAATLLALLPAVLVLFAPAWVSGIAMAVAFCGSLALNAVCLRLPSSVRDGEAGETAAAEPRVSPAAPPPPLPAKARLLTRASFTPAVMGFVHGLSFCCLVLTYGYPLSLAVAGAGAALAGVLSLVLIVREKAVPRVPEIEHIVFLVSALCLLALRLLDGAAALIVWVVLVAALLSYFIFNPRTVAVEAYRQTALSLHHCARENTVSLSATFLAWVALAALVCGGAELGQAASALGALALIGMIAEPLFTPYITYTAVEHLLDGGPAKSGADDGGPAGGKADDEMGWKRRCVDICREYEISPRETEVFMLLARGRNAEHIAGELFISTHTVRTHIYRIYRKLSINDRQELIDIVERGGK